MTQDDTRANFLTALDRADIDVSSFEAEFIESNLDRFNFSPKQRISIDKMMAKYADKIKFNPDKGPSLAARAEAEEERLADENRKMRRVVVGGKVKLIPANRAAVAVARPHVKETSQSRPDQSAADQP